MPTSKYYSCSKCKTGFLRLFDTFQLRMADGKWDQVGSISARNRKKKIVLVCSAITGLVYACYRIVISLYEGVLQKPAGWKLMWRLLFLKRANQTARKGILFAIRPIHSKIPLNSPLEKGELKAVRPSSRGGFRSQKGLTCFLVYWPVLVLPAVLGGARPFLWSFAASSFWGHSRFFFSLPGRVSRQSILSRAADFAPGPGLSISADHSPSVAAHIGPQPAKGRVAAKIARCHRRIPGGLRAFLTYRSILLRADCGF